MSRFVLLLSLALLPAPNAEDRVAREGRHIILRLKPEHWKLLTEEQARAWLEKLDLTYDAYLDLVGRAPFDGARIAIDEVDEYPGGWAVAGNPIRWHSQWVADTMRQVAKGDVIFGIIHEIGHDFDTDAWTWEPEFFADLKAGYAMERNQFTLELGGKWCDYGDPKGFRLQDYFDKVGKERNLTGDMPLPEDWTGSADAEQERFMMLVAQFGWDPFRKTFHDYVQLPRSAWPTLKEEKLALFIHLLSKHVGKDLAPWFVERGFPVLRTDHPKDALLEPGDFLAVLRRKSSLLVHAPLTPGPKITVAVPRHAAHGLYTHAFSNIVYRLDGRWRTFQAHGWPARYGRVQFQVKVDGKQAWESGKIRQDQDAAAPVDLDVTRAETLELVVLDGGDGIGSDEAAWIDATLVDDRGTRQWLQELTPVSAKQSWSALATYEGDYLAPGFPAEKISISAEVDGKSHAFEATQAPGVYEAPTLPRASNEVRMKLSCDGTVLLWRRKLPAGR